MLEAPISQLPQPLPQSHHCCSLCWSPVQPETWEACSLRLAPCSLRLAPQSAVGQGGHSMATAWVIPKPHLWPLSRALKSLRLPLCSISSAAAPLPGPPCCSCTLCRSPQPPFKALYRGYKGACLIPAFKMAEPSSTFPFSFSLLKHFPSF